MNKQKIVIALGGNALGNTPEEQLQLVKITAKTIVSLAKEGYSIIIGHGNGPQVGMINLSFDVATAINKGVPEMPFPECGAMSQGYIGYHLQQAIKNELEKEMINRKVASVVTQVVVEKEDPAFNNPTKPVGMFYSKEEADLIAKEKDFIFVEDAGRGYRRVVPSPKPKKIVELDVVEDLVENDSIVITVGGGGIPVVYENSEYKGIAAVIDKDFSSAKVAADTEADMLVILTAVDQVYINYNTPEQKALETLTIEDAKKYIKEGQFAKGSMLPKIEACISYLEAYPNGNALITSLQKASEALKGKTGTRIVR